MIDNQLQIRGLYYKYSLAVNDPWTITSIDLEKLTPENVYLEIKNTLELIN